MSNGKILILYFVELKMQTIIQILNQKKEKDILLEHSKKKKLSISVCLSLPSSFSYKNLCIIKNEWNDLKNK